MVVVFIFASTLARTVEDGALTDHQRPAGLHHVAHGHRQAHPGMLRRLVDLTPDRAHRNMLP